MIAGDRELAQVTLAQPYHPVRLHKHGLVSRVLRQAQALFTVLESAFIFGSHDINNGQAELRAEKLSDVVQLQAKLACSDESLLDFRQGVAFGDHQRLPDAVAIQPQLVLKLRIHQADRPGLLVVDEAQHDAASSMAFLHQRIRPKYILGLSATPFRTDKVKLCFDTSIRDAGIHQLIQDGYLAKPIDHGALVEAVASLAGRDPQIDG